MNILKLPKVIEKTGLSRASIYAFVKEGKFPKPISLGLRSVGWVEVEITQWIEEKMNSRMGSMS
ncbi:MAG: AlpA family transcriptional regulator [Alphaproteobacteria bacterium]|nr:AlpA family transcriptional regulator [Alphaproteobacteria bacterium]